MSASWLDLRAWWRRRSARRSHAQLEQQQREKLQRNVRGAVRVLCDSGLGAGLRSASGGPVPWYLVLGEHQSGKSCALRASGFEPIAAPFEGDGLPILVEAWCAGDAVAWELPGHTLEPAAGQPLLHEVLREIERRRPQRPLDGVLVTVAADQLLGPAGASDLAGAAQRLRACLDETQRQLGLELPVYLLVTKLDALPDFGAFWTRVEPELCQQPWGASWQERTPAEGSFGPRVSSELETLSRVLHARALHLAQVSGARAQAALFGFPERFSELGVGLASYVHQLSEQLPCRPRSLLRGFYLCSAHPPSPDAQASGWFFRELFRLAILSDRGAGARTPIALARRRFELCWQLCAILAGALLAVVPAGLSRRSNLELIDATRAALQPVPPAPDSRASIGRELDPLLAQLERLEAAERHFQLRHWWGPYTAPELRESVARVYRLRSSQVVTGPVQEQLLAALRATSDVPRFDWAAFRQTESTLKLYLMLSHPEHLDVEWAAPELLETWERARQRGACGGVGPLEPHVRRWLSALKEQSVAPWVENEQMVRRVRSRLESLPLDDLLLTWLADAARGVPPVRGTEIFDDASRAWGLGEDVGVPGLYTRAGWEKIRAALDSALLPAAEPWLFGQPLPAAGARERLQQRYFERYAQAWRGFFEALGAAAARGTAVVAGAGWGKAETLARIEALCEAEGPLVRLFQRFEQNARPELGEPAPGLGERALAALASHIQASPLGARPQAPVSGLEPQFRGLLTFGFGDAQGSSVAATSALSEYQRELRTLLAALRPPSDLPDAVPADLSALLTRIALTVERLLAPLARVDRDAIQGLLLAPIEGGLAATRAREAARLAELWRVDVAQPAQRLSERYPFDPAATEDASLADLQGFLAPQQGKLWRFLESELGGRVVELGGHFESRPGRGEEAVARGVLDCLGAARELREALFASGTPNLSFGVRLSSAGMKASAISLNVDGVSVAAEGVAVASAPERNAAPVSAAEEGAWSSLAWPGTGAPGAVIQLRAGSLADELRRMGTFGWWRLLSEGGLRPASSSEPGTLQASWPLNHGLTQVTVELRPRARARALGPSLFQHFHCPAGLFVARPGDPV